MAKRDRVRVAQAKKSFVRGNGNPARTQHVQELRRSNAAGVHGVNKPRRRYSVRDVLADPDAFDDLTD